MKNRKENRKFLKGFLTIYICSIFVFTSGLIKDGRIQLGNMQLFTPGGISSMCVASYYPALMEREEKAAFFEGYGFMEGENEKQASLGKSSAEKIDLVDSSENKKGRHREFGKEPAVLIVHTHATESYLPTASGNYHSKQRKNTVREVGEVLAKELQKEGISVVHDQTLHDSPSYSNSYSRSYKTTAGMLKEYPSIICVIDLHRDAISSKEPAPQVIINGKECARYSYVVSDSVATYDENLKFIKGLNKIAREKAYDDFTGKIIERGYKYNQDLSCKYMLLEIGYNTNHIDEAKNTAKAFAKILSKGLKTL